jgi:hypothetical protein
MLTASIDAFCMALTVNSIVFVSLTVSICNEEVRLFYRMKLNFTFN